LHGGDGITGEAASTRYDRAHLLSAGKRDTVLGLAEIERYGRDSFHDPDYVSLYGLRPADWYRRGVRLLARTAVECTRDALADLIGRDVAGLVGRARPGARCLVVDPFAGSGNTLVWLARHLPGSRGLGLEVDDGVFAASARNLALLDLDVTLLHEGHEAGLQALAPAPEELLVVFLAPPWGAAFDARAGLDPRGTQPPLPEIVELLAATFPGRELVLAVQIHETALPASIADVARPCAWSQRRLYAIDPPGRNHGLLLATLGFDPG
jgi:hypothetical protein